MSGLENWLSPHFAAVRTAQAWRAFDIHPALDAMLDWPQRQALQRAAPSQFHDTPRARSAN